MKKITTKLKKFFSKKPVMIGLIILALAAVLMAIYFMFIVDTSGEIIYKDYTIASGHTGEIAR